jgi:hypothetical protein
MNSPGSEKWPEATFLTPGKQVNKEKMLLKSAMDGGFQQHSQSSGRTPACEKAICPGNKWWNR